MIKLLRVGGSFPRHLEVSWQYLGGDERSYCWFAVRLSENLRLRYDFGRFTRVTIYITQLDALGRSVDRSFHANDPSYSDEYVFSELAGRTATAILKSHRAESKRKARGCYTLQPDSIELANLLTTWKRLAQERQLDQTFIR